MDYQIVWYRSLGKNKATNNHIVIKQNYNPICGRRIAKAEARMTETIDSANIDCNICKSKYERRSNG